jgi:hypothetical protein
MQPIALARKHSPCGGKVGPMPISVRKDPSKKEEFMETRTVVPQEECLFRTSFYHYLNKESP